MSKRTQALLTKSVVLVNKSARVALDASYAVEELCGLIDPLTEENKMLTKHCSKLEKEIDRWKDLMAKEVARLKADFHQASDERADYAKDVSKLKAEVERLRASSFVTAVPVEQYERVVKAGDAMARIIAPPTHGTGEWDGEWEAWNAAKEGKRDIEKVEIDDETFERENKAYKEARAKEAKAKEGKKS